MSNKLHESIGKEINILAADIYQQNVTAGWWRDAFMLYEISATGDFDNSFLARLEVNIIAAKIALMHSELSEALEGFRKDLKDDHLPKRQMIEVEFADAIIRILDTAAHLHLDVGGAIAEKLEYNKNRADHKQENRDSDGGKKI